MSSLTFAVMGCGRIARRHCELLAGADYARLVAVCDVIPERAEAFGERYGVPAFADAVEMARAVAPDVVCVLTPSGMHADHGVALAPHVANLVVEKPIDLSLAAADRLIARCDELDRRLFVVKQNRFNLPVTRLRRALDEGRFGRLVMGTVRVRWSRDQAYYDADRWRGTWAQDGGVLLNQGIHHLDLLEWLMGPVDTVRGYDATQLVDTETPDTAVAVLRFVSGALGVVEATTATRPRDLEGSLSVLGERGSVEIGGFAVNRLRHWRFDEPRPEDDRVLAEFSENPPDVYGFGHRRFLRHVRDCIVDGATPLIDRSDARRSLELAHAIHESARTGAEVGVHDRSSGPRRS
jgi:UDP-N-acetyl-2-amino-2-deoxyglucuronate dehydrogenase